MKEQIGNKLSIKMVDNHFIIKYLYIANPTAANAPMLIEKAMKICDTPEDFLAFIKEWSNK